MKSITMTRTQRRKMQQKRVFHENLKKTTVLASTAVVGCGVVGPLLTSVTTAEATNTAQVSSRVNTSAFISELAGHAQGIASANDLYASVMIAQAIVESGWGTSTLSQAPNHNLFGIKGSYQGQTVYMDT